MLIRTFLLPHIFIVDLRELYELKVKWINSNYFLIHFYLLLILF